MVARSKSGSVSSVMLASDVMLASNKKREREKGDVIGTLDPAESRAV